MKQILRIRAFYCKISLVLGVSEMPKTPFPIHPREQIMTQQVGVRPPVHLRNDPDSAVAQTNLGVCDDCIEKFKDRLRKTLPGVDYIVDSQPHSHIVVTVSGKLSDQRCSRLMYAISEAVQICHRLHPQP